MHLHYHVHPFAAFLRFSVLNIFVSIFLTFILILNAVEGLLPCESTDLAKISGFHLV